MAQTAGLNVVNSLSMNLTCLMNAVFFRRSLTSTLVGGVNRFTLRLHLLIPFYNKGNKYTRLEMELGSQYRTSS